MFDWYRKCSLVKLCVCIRSILFVLTVLTGQGYLTQKYVLLNRTRNQNVGQSVSKKLLRLSVTWISVASQFGIISEYWNVPVIDALLCIHHLHILRRRISFVSFRKLSRFERIYMHTSLMIRPPMNIFVVWIDLYVFYRSENQEVGSYFRIWTHLIENGDEWWWMQ